MSDIHYLEDKDGAIKERIQSFDELKHWTIPPLHIESLELKYFDECKKQYEDIINISIQKIVDKDYINELVYYSTIDRLIAIDTTYSSFLACVRELIDAKCKDAPNHV